MLRTRSPLIPGPKPGSPLDLHVLSTPPAFVLSQDQTLRRESKSPNREVRGFVSVLEPASFGQALPSEAFELIPPVCPDGFSTTRRLGSRHGKPRLPADGKGTGFFTLFSSQGARRRSANSSSVCVNLAEQASGQGSS